MSTVNRDFGKPPALKDILPRAKEFTDMALQLEIDELLDTAKTQRSIARTAAQLCGVKLQLEGEIFSKDIVEAAYSQVSDVMGPSLTLFGADTTQLLLKTDTTHDTLTQLSRDMDSYEFSKLTYEYSKDGSHLDVTEDGLITQPDFVILPKMEAQRGGCPYAKNQAAGYFNRLTDRIVDTYAEAHRRDMPTGWFNLVARSIGIR